MKFNVTEEVIKEALKEVGEISIIRLDKLPLPLVRIGYIVFEQAADASRLI